MKVLFVDDEKIIREGISSLIHWEELGCEQLETADSADSALSAMARNDFDLVITDICMQKMTGIELAKRIKEIKPDTKIIILSAFEDFSYARDAIEIGVIKYILKPVTPEELEEAVQEAMKQVQSDMQLANRIIESEKFVNIYRPQLAKDFWRAVIQKEITEQIDLEQRMKLAGIEINAEELCCIMLQSDQFEINEYDVEMAEKVAEKIMIRCHACLKLSENQAVLVTKAQLDMKAMLQLQNLIEEIWAKPVRLACGRLVQKCTDLHISLEDAALILSKRQKHTPKDLVSESIRLIEHNISNEAFGVNDIADTLHISASYLSKIFKKSLGATCIEFITQKRLDKAKDLLAHTSMTQEEIAHAVGYANVHHFSMMFKKQSKETPGQYRKRVRKTDV